jgi:hypothetical protein
MGSDRQSGSFAVKENRVAAGATMVFTAVESRRNQSIGVISSCQFRRTYRGARPIQPSHIRQLRSFNLAPLSKSDLCRRRGQCSRVAAAVKNISRLSRTPVLAMIDSAVAML